MKNRIFILLAIVLIFVTGCGSQIVEEQIPGNLSCSEYSIDECPNDCVICPPAMTASSISCQTPEFCQDMGIDENWYEKVSQRIQGKKFNDCLDAGNPVMESYPRQCRMDDNTYTEYIGNEMELMELIHIDFPRPNSKIISPIVISGEVIGEWFFEGDFPIELRDASDQIIAGGYVSAQSDWMIDGFVRFEAQLDFVKPASKTGMLILMKDNVSGLSEHDKSLEIPVYFE